MSDKTRRRRHSAKQIVQKIEQADRLLKAGQSVGQVLQSLGVSQATYHRWRQQYWGDESQRSQAAQGVGAEERAAQEVVGRRPS